MALRRLLKLGQAATQSRPLCGPVCSKSKTTKEGEKGAAATK